MFRFRKPERRSTLDVWIACGFFLVAYIAAALLDLNDSWRLWTQPFRMIGLDALPMALAITVGIVVWFAWRRWQEGEESRLALSETVERLQVEVEERKHAQEIAQVLSETKNEVLDNEYQRSEQLAQVSKMGDFLAAASSPEELKEISAKCLRNLLPHLTVGVMFADKSFSRWQLHSAWGEHYERIHPHVDAEQCWVLRRGQQYADQSNTQTMLCNEANVTELKTVACYPIFCREMQFGVLHIRSAEWQEHILSAEEEKMIVGVCNTIGLHFYNAQLRAELSMASNRDELTGLLNRRGLGNTLKREITAAGQQGYKVTVAMIDIDHFKAYNDTYGHPEGDKALKFIAEQLASNLRARDVVARYGGEEFILVLPNTTKAEAYKKLKAMLVSINKASVSSSECCKPITLSIGIATSPDDQTDEERLVKLADTALYAAKKRGRNCVIPYISPHANNRIATTQA